MKRTLSVIVCCITCVVCVHAHAHQQQVVCKGGIALVAEIEERVVDFHWWQNFTFKTFPHVKGHLHISNTAASVGSFSTKEALLSVQGASPVRAYVNTLSSQIVDTGGVKLEPGQILDLEVYWPVQRDIGLAVRPLDLACAAG
jgi:hypothetical protein